MAVYTVFEPPQPNADTLGHADRFVFVRDGFSWPAFLLAPLWMLRHRLWLAFVGYLVVGSALAIGLRLIGASTNMRILVALLFCLLIGFEASTLRRWRLARRGWSCVGVVIGDDVEAAERRFFDAWVRDGSDYPPVEVSGAPPPRPPRPASSPDVIGLFPQPGMRA